MIRIILFVFLLLVICNGCSGYDDPCDRCLSNNFYNANTYYCEACASNNHIDLEKP